MMRFLKKILLFSLTLSLFFSLTFKAYAADEQHPKTGDFPVLFSDADEQGGSGLATCEHKVDSKDPVQGWVQTKAWATRNCDAPTPDITMGPAAGKDCRNQGTHTCRVTGRSTDNAGNVSAEAVAPLFSIAFCVPPAAGDWEIVAICVLTDQNYPMAGNIIIRAAGVLDMRGTTNITFDTSAARYVYVYPGGQLLQAGTAGFNK